MQKCFGILYLLLHLNNFKVRYKSVTENNATIKSSQNIEATCLLLLSLLHKDKLSSQTKQCYGLIHKTGQSS